MTCSEFDLAFQSLIVKKEISHTGRGRAKSDEGISNAALRAKRWNFHIHMNIYVKIALQKNMHGCQNGRHVCTPTEDRFEQGRQGAQGLGFGVYCYLKLTEVPLLL